MDPESATGHSTPRDDDERDPVPQSSQGNSPWSVDSWPDIRNDYNAIRDDSLRLAPLNPTPQNFNLPSLDDPDFFPNPPANPFARERANHNEPIQFYDPPPSNQQARDQAEAELLDFEFDLGASQSPADSLFGDFLNTPPRMPTPGPVASRSVNQTRSSSFVDLTESSPPHHTEMAPSRTSRKRKSPGNDVATAPKPEQPEASAADLSKVSMVDLVDVEDAAQYEEMKAKAQADMIRKQNEDEANKPIKLAAFNCIICMDNPTDLTVTHCGHLFCSECLFQALHAGDKKCCPVCRTAISTGKGPNHKPPRNGVFPLEMKFMTSSKKGKQPDRSLNGT